MALKVQRPNNIPEIHVRSFSGMLELSWVIREKTFAKLITAIASPNRVS